MKRVVLVIVVLALIAVSAAAGSVLIDKRTLPRENIYYEISNDGDDFGNYIEFYNIPIQGHSKKLFCVVYSDKIGDGGGAGLSCNWDRFNGAR